MSRIDPTTADLLRATAALVRHVQANPTEAKRTATLRQARAGAERRWLEAGCPDLPLRDDEAPPMRPPAPCVVPPGDDDRDWSPVTVTVEIDRVSEKALMVRTDDVTAWAPRSLCWLPGTRDPVEVEAGDIIDMDVPRWLATEKEIG